MWNYYQDYANGAIEMQNGLPIDIFIQMHNI